MLEMLDRLTQVSVPVEMAFFFPSIFTFHDFTTLQVAVSKPATNCKYTILCWHFRYPELGEIYGHASCYKFSGVPFSLK